MEVPGTVRDRMRARAPAELNGSWMVLCVPASALVLAVAWFGVRLPHWILNAANPPAWLSNVVGLTGWGERVFGAMDQFVGWLPEKIGLPVIGSLLIWFVLGCVSSGRGMLSGIMPIAFCIALQFTVQRGYFAVAEHLRATGDALSEAAALARAFEISDRARAWGVIKSRAIGFGPSIRAGELEAGPEARALFRRSPAADLRIGQVTIRLVSDHVPVPFPSAPTRTIRGFTSYKNTLAEIVRKVLPDKTPEFDVEGLCEFNILDLSYYAGLSVAANLVTSLEPLKKQFPDQVNELLATPAELTVHIHDSGRKLLESFQGAPLSSVALQGQSVLVAFYDRRERTLHLGVDEDVYRAYILTMLRSGPGISSNASLTSQGEFYQFLSATMHTPLVHELWHFTAQHLKLFNGLPAALEEGIATIGEAMTESVTESAVANMSLFRLREGKFVYRDPERERTLARHARLCPANARHYLELLAAAETQGSLMPLPDLARLDSQGIVARPDASLLYAEGWALAYRIMFDRKKFDEVHAALARLPGSNPEMSLEDHALWARLGRDAVDFVKDICTQDLGR